MVEQRYHFNYIFLKRFGKIQKIVFPKLLTETSILFVTLLALELLKQVVIYYVGLLPSKYYVVLGDKNWHGFLDHVVYSLLLIIVIAFLYATSQYVAKLFYISSRRFITCRLHQLYFTEVFYYDVNVLNCCVDNPDQRITQDVDKMCLTYSEIIPTLLLSPFTIGYYTYQTWNKAGYLGPLCVLLFFILFVIVNKFLMSPVVDTVQKQQNLEGDFRFKHMLMRSYAESIAFFRAGSVEYEKCEGRFMKLITTQQKLAFKEWILNMSVNLSSYLGSILSYIIIAIPIFAGKYDDKTPSEMAAIISANSFVIIYLIYCFTQLLALADGATEVAGTAHRVGLLLERFAKLKPVADTPSTSDDISTNRDVPDSESESTSESKCPAVTLQQVSYGPPMSQQTLVKQLNLQVCLGVNLLVTGDSGCGKSSLLRVINGLWPVRQGYVKQHLDNACVMYLPQKPVFTDGSLRDQIIYPGLRRSKTLLTDGKLIDMIHDFGLAEVYKRVTDLDVMVDWNWYDVLSPGEMQRLSFVRLFYHYPKLAVLDEATSQVDEKMERKLYTYCQNLHITTLSVGHRPSLKEYHDFELSIHTDMTWNLTDLKYTRM